MAGFDIVSCLLRLFLSRGKFFLTGIVKLLAIAFTVCFGWPGGLHFCSCWTGLVFDQSLLGKGIIFPLYFAGALLGQGWGMLLNVRLRRVSFAVERDFQVHPTIACTTFMAALEASVLRTPWASVHNVFVALMFDF